MSLRPTRAEGLLISRNRLGLTQAEMAKLLGVCLSYYREMEAGTREVPLDFLKYSCPSPGPRGVERCLLLRRRAGLGQRELGKMMGVSQMWVNRMERGSANPDRLMAYWRSNGLS